MRAKIVKALRKINRTRRRLEAYLHKAKARERELMEKVVEAQKNGDELRAKVYANEVAKLRKFMEVVTVFEARLEQAELWLQSVLMFGDAGASLKPVMDEIKTIVGPLKALLPEIEEEMNDLIETMDELAEEELIGGTYVDVFLDGEAEKIMKEAQLIAQKRFEEGLVVASGEGSKA